MSREFSVGDEPVPGYRLTALLGEGSFGKVWRANGPGGTEVALKVTSLLDSKRGMREFRSLRLVKRLRHPNLVPIVGIWLVDSNGVPLDDSSIDQLGASVTDSKGAPASGSTVRTLQFNAARAERLIVAMGLGERDLFALLREYRDRGEPGIPVDKALDYMEEAAKALDYLNEQRHDLGDGQLKSIYHCDIKPSNIMLVGNAVQVCDLGLARINDMRATSAALTCAYGAPELYWSKTRQPTGGTDQYSLAVSYYELRTCQLPFSTDMSQLDVLMAHRDGTLDFSGISPAEQAVIRRATSPDPAGRYESCVAMVRDLRAAATGAADLLQHRLDGESQSGWPGARSSLTAGRALVPGYQLGEHLFHADVRTVVWSATDINGRYCSLWIYDLANVSSAIDLDALRVLQGQAAHPHLARIFGWWLLNESGEDITSVFTDERRTGPEVVTLVIASESARVNLLHRAQERRQVTGFGLPVEELLDYMRQVSSALDAINVSLVHTDVRPSNLLVLDRNVKLSNLAWCRVLDQDASDADVFENRPLRTTSPPEIAEGRVDRRSDQYSLAATYVQLRSGNTVLESAYPSAQTQAFSPNEVGLSDLEPQERLVIERAMNASPGQRFAACEDLVDALAEAVCATLAPATALVGNTTSAFDRGTLMPGAPPGESPLSRSSRARETVWNRGATTDPEVPMPRNPWPARIVSLGMAIALLGGGTALFVSGRWEKVWVALVGSATETSPHKSLVPRGTTPPDKELRLSEVSAPDDVAEPDPRETPSTPATPEVLFQKDMDDAERWLAAGDDEKAEVPLSDAEKRLSDLLDPAVAQQRWTLFRAWLEAERKQFDDAQRRLNDIAPEALVAENDPLRFDILRALVLARLNGPLADQVDLTGVAKALRQVRQRVSGWHEPALHRDHLWQQARSLAGATIDLAVKYAAADSAEKRGAARRALDEFPEADVKSLDQTLLIPLRVANAALVLANAESPWQEVQSALSRCDEQAEQLVDADRRLLGSRLLSWAKQTAEPGVLGPALDAYERLGELPKDALHADLMIGWIEQLAWTEAIDWRVLAEASAKADLATREHKRHYLVSLCEAECLLELDKDAGKALRKLPAGPAAPPADASPADQAYAAYVSLRVEQAAFPGRPNLGQFDRFCEQSADSPPCLASAARQRAAAELLAKAAGDLAARNGFGALTFLSAESGGRENPDRAFHWLDRARALNRDAAQGEYAIQLAAASLEKTDPIAPPPLPDEAGKQPDLRRSVLFIKARAAALQAKPTEAIRQFATLWSEINGSPGQPNWLEVYQQVVKPALNLAATIKEAEQNAETRSSVGSLYAAKGRMVQLDAGVDRQVHEETKKSRREAIFEAYDRAIASDPNVAEYYIQRGMNRDYLDYKTAEKNLTALKAVDIERARTLLKGQESASLRGALGYAHLLDARATADNAGERRVDFLKQAATDAQAAADQCGPQSEAYPGFQLLRSMACLELANSTTEKDDVIRQYLDEAVASAKLAEAGLPGPHPEYAIRARGNAEEDYGLLVRDFPSYRRAIRTFEDARDVAFRDLSFSEQDEARMALARARYRLALSDAEPAKTASLLDQGLADLQAVIQEARLPPPRLAEAFCWEARIYALQMNKTRDASSIAKFKRAADQALGEALKRVDRGSPVWTMYQSEWAPLGPTPEAIRERARPLLATSDMPFSDVYRAQALSLIANSYSAGVTAATSAEQRQRARASGLAEYRRQLSWLPDVEEAGTKDIRALLALSEFLYVDREFWTENWKLCKESAERAQTLANQTGALDLEAQAHYCLAAHAIRVVQSTPATAEQTLSLALKHAREAVNNDDKLESGRLTALERQGVRAAFSPRWRYQLAELLGAVAGRTTAAAERRRLCQEGIQALNNAKDLPTDFKRDFDKLKTTLGRL